MNSTELSMKNNLLNKKEKLLENSLDNSLLLNTAKKQAY